MADSKYFISLLYNFNKPDWGETSIKVFSAIAKRKLVFTSETGSGQKDHNAIRVFIRYGSVKEGYSPHTEGMPKLEKALDELVKSLE